MNWILWYVTDEDFVEVARFAYQWMADLMKMRMPPTVGHYAVTPEGQTPIW